MLSLFTDQFEAMKNFYAYTLEFTIQKELENYVEFSGQSVRFVICNRKVMRNAVEGEHYDQPATGHPLSFAFSCESQSDLDAQFQTLIEKGATKIQAGKVMPWNQYAAFFADPDGHIHELFAPL